MDWGCDAQENKENKMKNFCHKANERLVGLLGKVYPITNMFSLWCEGDTKTAFLLDILSAKLLGRVILGV